VFVAKAELHISIFSFERLLGFLEAGCNQLMAQESGSVNHDTSAVFLLLI